MDNRGSLLGAMGRIDESIALFRDVLARRIRVQGDSHPDVAWTLGALGNRLQDKGNLAEAESLKSVAFRLTRVGQPPGSPVISRLLNNLATLNFRMERFDTAAKIQRDVLAEWTASLGAEHPSTLTAKHNLGFMLTELGQYGEAERMIREALAGRRRVRQHPHEDIGASLRSLGVLLLRTGRHGEAERTLREALAVHEAATDSMHPRVAEASLALGEVLCTRGTRTEGTRHARRAVGIREAKTPGSYHVAEARRVLAACLANTSARAEAESLLVSAYEIVREDPYKQREADRIRGALNRLRQ